jgi:hypothetical protein
MNTGTASPLEILAAVLNVVGILAAWRMFALTKVRHDAVIRTGGTEWGPRILVAWRHFRCEGSRIAYHVITLALGMWAMTLPDSDSAYGTAVMLGNLTLAGIFTAMSLLDLKNDSRLDNLLRGGA